MKFLMLTRQWNAEAKKKEDVAFKDVNRELHWKNFEEEWDEKEEAGKEEGAEKEVFPFKSENFERYFSKPKHITKDAHHKML